jgi:hypothetical protein
MLTLTPKQSRGRVLLLIAIGVTLFGDACFILLKLSRFGLVPESIGSAMRWFITAALFYAVWRGHHWVRWLMVGLMALGLFLTVPAMLRTLNPLFICLALQFSIALSLLAFPPSVSAFIDHQREQHSKTDPQS